MSTVPRVQLPLVSVLLLFAASGMAQYPVDSASLLRWGAAVASTTGPYYTTLSASACVRYKRSVFVFGPHIFLSSTPPNSNILKGFQAAWKLYPNPVQSLLDFYFISNLSYNLQRHEESRMYTDPTGGVSSATYRHAVHNWELNVGYGFDFKIDRFFLDFSVAFGFATFSENYWLDVPGYPPGSYAEEGKFLDGLDVATMVKVGVGITI